MKKRWHFEQLCVGIAALCLVSAVVEAGEEEASWYSVEENVIMTLVYEKKELGAWEQELAKKENKNLEDVLTLFQLALRCGRTDDALSALELFPNENSPVIASELVSFCRNQHAPASIMQRYLELFPNGIMQLGEIPPEIYADWDDEKLLAWIEEQIRKTENHESLPPWYQPSLRWSQLRLDQLTRMGRVQDEIKKWSQEAIDNPTDSEATLRVLRALSWLLGRTGHNWAPKFEDESLNNLAWLKKSLPSLGALDAFESAETLSRLGYDDLAILFMEDALERRLTEGEIKRYQSHFSALLSAEMYELFFRCSCMERFSKIYLKQEKKDEAQKWMLAAHEFRKKHNITGTYHFAGAVQAATGERVVEKEILEKEELSRDDPQYWRDRAEYYEGRKEWELCKDALLHGLELCPLSPEIIAAGKDYNNLYKDLSPRDQKSYAMRPGFLRDLVRVCGNLNQGEEATKLALDELRAHGGSDYANWTIGILASNSELFDPTDPIYWEWLAQDKKWGYYGERLLKAIFSAEKRRGLPSSFERAKALALAPDAHPARANILGEILHVRDGSPYSELSKSFEMSVFLFQEAMRRSEGFEEWDLRRINESASANLLHTWIQLKDHKKAEEAFLLGSRALVGWEKTGWLTRIRDIAVKNGDTEAATRLDRRLHNISWMQFPEK
ncbi:MAG: hypothetical protein Q4D38_08880 [Planctomycetia bacterium]|nr:hypothetical protein [Planctomycetia bacterium]